MKKQSAFKSGNGEDSNVKVEKSKGRMKDIRCWLQKHRGGLE